MGAGYRRAAEAVRSGELGWIHTIRANTGDAFPPPAEYLPTSGGFFRDCNVHDFDIIRFVTGHEVVSAYAVGANRGEKIFAEEVERAIAGHAAVDAFASDRGRKDRTPVEAMIGAAPPATPRVAAW